MPQFMFLKQIWFQIVKFCKNLASLSLETVIVLKFLSATCSFLVAKKFSCLFGQNFSW